MVVLVSHPIRLFISFRAKIAQYIFGKHFFSIRFGDNYFFVVFLGIPFQFVSKRNSAVLVENIEVNSTTFENIVNI